MKREVLLLKEAQRDIGKIAEYLEGVSIQATQRFHEALEAVFDHLEIQADIGQRYDFADGSETGLRFWRLKSFGDFWSFIALLVTRSGFTELFMARAT